MSEVKMLNMAGETVGTIELNDAVFGIEPNQNAVHAVVKNILANKRQGTQSAKTRAEVRGGGRKPFRQKGTGRHRQGSSTDPSQVGGGIVFAPKPRSYRYTLPKKLRRLAMFSALSSKVAENEIIVVGIAYNICNKTFELDGINLPITCSEAIKIMSQIKLSHTQFKLFRRTIITSIFVNL